MKKKIKQVDKRMNVKKIFRFQKSKFHKKLVILQMKKIFMEKYQYRSIFENKMI
jgi:hypothetical protein